MFENFVLKTKENKISIKSINRMTVTIILNIIPVIQMQPSRQKPKKSIEKEENENVSVICVYMIN